MKIDTIIGDFMIQEMIQHNIWLISSFILGIVILAKTIAKKTATVDVLWLIIFGALFANLGLIPKHHEVLEYIGEWGIVFIMFALGFDEDLDHFKEGLKRSLGIAIIGAIFPFLAGFLSAKMFGYNDSVALLWGLTMTATAVSLTMVSLKAKNMHKSTKRENSYSKFYILCICDCTCRWVHNTLKSS